MPIQSAVEAALASHGNHVSAAGGAVSLTGLITQSWFIGLIGLMIALAGFMLQWYYQAKRDRREQKEHEARMKGMT